MVAVLGIDRHAARITWTVLLVLLVCWLLYVLWHTLVVFVIAVLFAYLLSPLVDLINRLLPSWRSQMAALAIVYLILLAGLIAFVVLIGSRVVDQATVLVNTLPGWLAKLDQSSQLPLVGAIRGQIEANSKELISYLPKAGLQLLSAASNIIYVVIVPILAFFFLKDGRRLLGAAVGALSDFAPRPFLEELLADVHLLLAQYMRALVTLSAATFVFYGTFFAILRTPYAILLAAIAAVLEFIPVAGPLVASLLIVLVAAFSGAAHVLPILIFLGVYRLFQDYVLQPHLMSAGVELHPLAVLFGAFAGGQIAGVMGTFLSVPAMATLRIIYRRLRKMRGGADPAGAA